MEATTTNGKWVARVSQLHLFANAVKGEPAVISFLAQIASYSV
ncbi:hypothetical protein [Microcoleus sp. FACHB-672]|nr:hypothetical protein [Microcoleus sp. FACHB-672]